MIKPLEWKHYPEGQACAETILRSDYWVRFPISGPEEKTWHFGMGCIVNHGGFDTKEQAIDAANADYAARVMGLLNWSLTDE